MRWLRSTRWMRERVSSVLFFNETLSPRFLSFSSSKKFGVKTFAYHARMISLKSNGSLVKILPDRSFFIGPFAIRESESFKIEKLMHWESQFKLTRQSYQIEFDFNSKKATFELSLWLGRSIIPRSDRVSSQFLIGALLNFWEVGFQK